MRPLKRPQATALGQTFALNHPARRTCYCPPRGSTGTTGPSRAYSATGPVGRVPQ
jgi:hypothetical protein